jgi:probable DNA metabolism protein
METSTTWVYDGTFNGFLSCIYKAFEKGNPSGIITKVKDNEQELFRNQQFVATDIALAKLVWNGIGQKRHTANRIIYFAFLSETGGIEMMLYTYIKSLMGVLKTEETEDLHVLFTTLNQLAEKVEVEKRRIETFVQFQCTADEGYVAYTRPKYNVLPLLSKHLKEKYRNDSWQIFDLKRNYGMVFNQGMVEFTPLQTNLKRAV